ncbi:hypothetical protein H2200_006909 [Cladophialophora chaetospira]|uniref:Uncharacterized protein n=1 Tax=Cladophialophora chaetospira TaxID=386627 RepID=A0AA38X936_9EURO|nr:hypothetical protein H2200_006909 [Cladophialophora chaetospira]
MAAVEPAWPFVSDVSVPTGMPTWKPTQFDVQSCSARKASLDESLYNITVLRLPATASEDELDNQVSIEAQNLGILPVYTPSHGIGISSSMSMMTIASDSTNQSPVRSHSTMPTSCASSEHRPSTRSSRIAAGTRSNTDSHPFASEADRKKGSPLARGFRKISGFRKKRSGALTSSSTLSSISSDAETNNSEIASIDMQSPPSIKSNKSSWSHPATTKPGNDPPPLLDMEALKRSMESKELLDLRMMQMEERARFLEFQTSLLSDLRSQRDVLKAQKKAEHEIQLPEQAARNERAVEDFEARQLEEEMKMEEEHDMEKRAIMLRLRHMEAYCQNPTPPPTPVDPSSGRPSTDSILPERKVTEKDYHILAQQYRERDIMDSLHASKINVLRGKQKKAVDRFAQKKEKELETLERDQRKELALIDREFTSQESDLRLELDKKRARLENRWRIQTSIVRTKLEKATGLNYAPLADVIAIEDVNPSSRP